MKQYTCFCSLLDDPRGFYSEEIDVTAPNPAQAKKKVEKIIEEGYDKKLKVRRVIWRRVPEVQIWSV